MTRAERARALAPLALFAAITALYAVPVLRHPGYWGRPDWDQFTFWSAVPRETILRYGRFPLWDPWANGGNVMLAMPHSSFLSPAFLLVLAFGPVVGLKLQWLGALLLGLVGMHRLAGRLGMGPLARLLPPLVLMLSSHFTLHLREGHVEWIALSLLPWAVLLHRAPEERRGIALTALTLALMLYSGSVYVLAVTVFFLAVHDAARAADEWSLRPLGRLAGVLALAGLLGAFKLLPMAQLMRASPRPTPAEARFEPRTAAAALLDRRQNLLYEEPRLLAGRLGVPWPKDREKWHEFGAYVGVAPLLLAALGLFAVRWTHAPLLAAGAACLWVAAGRSPPVSLWEALHALPVFGSLHVPSRFLMGGLLSFALLAGLGASELERRGQRGRALLAALLLATLVDLGAVLRPILADAFPIPPQDVVRDPAFRQGWSDAALLAAGSTSAMYPALLSNRGAIDDYEIVHVPRGDVRAFGSPAYRGEAYLVPSAAPAPVLRSEPGLVAVSVDPSKGAFVMLNQNDFAGWRYRAGARGGRAVSVNGLVAAPLAPGDTEVVFTYRPASVELGGALSALGALVLLGLLRRRA